MNWERFINCHYSIYEQTAFNRYGRRLEKFTDACEDTVWNMVYDESPYSNGDVIRIDYQIAFATDVMIDLAENMLI